MKKYLADYWVRQGEFGDEKENYQEIIEAESKDDVFRILTKKSGVIRSLIKVTELKN